MWFLLSFSFLPSLLTVPPFPGPGVPAAVCVCTFVAVHELPGQISGIGTSSSPIPTVP